MASEVCRASDRGPARDPSDPEMVEGRRVGGRGVEGDEDRDAPGGSGFTLAGKHLSASRLRSLGGAVAAEECAGGHDHGPLRRRQCATSAKGRGGPNVCNCLIDEGRCRSKMRMSYSAK